jgi:hypothetical protein
MASRSSAPGPFLLARLEGGALLKWEEGEKLMETKSQDSGGDKTREQQQQQSVLERTLGGSNPPLQRPETEPPKDKDK